MKDSIEKIKKSVRGIMSEVAKLLDELTNGFIRAWHVTLLSLIGHIFVMLAISEGLLSDAAILLAGFALLDALDGAIARYQGTASPSGMLLDSTTDRIKESLIYAGLAYYFAQAQDPLGALYAVLALGFSFAVSYVKAKGEVALLETTSSKRKKNDINREFEAGIFGYEIRMLVVIVALLAQEPLLGAVIVAGGSLLTYLVRFNDIARRLNGAD